MRQKNMSMANKGKKFERLIEDANRSYKSCGIARIHFLPTSWKPKRRNGEIVGAKTDKKSNLDFYGTVTGGLSISFDVKETEELDGLPLKNIADHQIDFIRESPRFNEISFLLVHLTGPNKFYFVHGPAVINAWEQWQANKGKRGYNKIKLTSMTEIKAKKGISLDYLEPLHHKNKGFFKDFPW